MTRINDGSGLVQKLVVEADTRDQLIGAIMIACAWHKKVSHFVTGVDARGVPYLSLLWGEHDASARPLIAPMSDAIAIAAQIESWLRTVEYPAEPDHDGSNHRGFLLLGAQGPEEPERINGGWRACAWDFYTVVTVQPKWIEYGK